MKPLALFLLSITFVGSIMVLTGCGTNADDHAVLLPVKDDPTVAFRLWVKVGSQNDPAGKEGLAALTANLISEGSTQTNSYEQILEKLYPMAAGYGVSVDKEMTIVSGRTHKDNLKDYLTLFVDAIAKPAFTESDFTRVKSMMLTHLEKTLRYSSDEELGKAALYNFVFQGTPYGHHDYGTVASLNAITIQDIKDFYKKYYTKDNIVIGLGGGYDDALYGDLKKQFSTLLPAGPVQAPDKPAPSAIDGMEVFMVEKPCDATAISFGFPIDVLRGDEDFWALALFNSWFGEHRNSSSHLYQVIREVRGMNYGDYSYVEAFKNGGALQMRQPNAARRKQLFEVWIRPVQHVHRHFALRAAMRELKKVVDNGMTKEEFELTQQFLTKYALHYATATAERLGYGIDSKFYGIDVDYVALFRQKVGALTLDQVNAAIKKHIQYKNLKIAVVTQNAEQFKTDLVANTPSPVSYDTPKPETVLAEDKEIEAFPLAVKAEKVTIVPVEKMF